MGNTLLSPHHTPTTEDAFGAFDIEAARRYDAWYETANGLRVAAAEEALLGEMLVHLPSASTLLDVGCGTGHFTRWFARSGLRIVGLDTSAAMLAVARESDGGPRYVLGTAERLPFADASFDLVALITSLEFVSEPVLAMREAARVARCGLLLGVLNLASPLGLWRKLLAFFRPSPYRRARFYTPRSLMRLVQMALPCHSPQIIWREALWPKCIPLPLHRICGGAFIGLAVSLTSDRDGQRKGFGRQS